MVIADPHVMPQSLIATYPNFDDYMQHQRKMLDLSEPILYALMDTALLYSPDLVLIPGDLTKDGEPEAHSMVAAALQQLNNAGIPTLVIPGNHDLPDSNQWDSLYLGSQLTKDPNSHSIVAEPLAGVTVLGIDGSHGSASVGSLSVQTLAWLLAQADSAAAKGNMIIAMCHWQLLEHVDKQARLESSCRLQDAEAVRDSLMNHGVHLILTGHFHVNGITTYRNEQQTDSLVEITTGSPITYPCPYRWLTVSADRKAVEVQTDYITTVDTIADLHTYSREWMREHATNMIPQMSLRLWNRVDDAKAMVAEQFSQTIADRLANKCIPKTDSAKIALVEKHLGSTVVELYLLHSDANEPEHPEADSLAQALYTGMDNMISEMLDADPLIKFTLLAPMTIYANSVASEPVESLVQDETQRKTDYPDRTDDLTGTLTINTARNQALDTNMVQEELLVRKTLQNGQLIIQRGAVLYNAIGQQVGQ